MVTVRRHLMNNGELSEIVENYPQSKPKNLAKNTYITRF